MKACDILMGRNMVLVLQIWCCVMKHGFITLLIVMMLTDTTTVQVLFTVSLFHSWNITTVEVNSGVHLLISYFGHDNPSYIFSGVQNLQVTRIYALGEHSQLQINRGENSMWAVIYEACRRRVTCAHVLEFCFGPAQRSRKGIDWMTYWLEAPWHLVNSFRNSMHWMVFTGHPSC